MIATAHFELVHLQAPSDAFNPQRLWRRVGLQSSPRGSDAYLRGDLPALLATAQRLRAALASEPGCCTTAIVTLDRSDHGRVASAPSWAKVS